MRIFPYSFIWIQSLPHHRTLRSACKFELNSKLPENFIFNRGKTDAAQRHLPSNRISTLIARSDGEPYRTNCPNTHTDLLGLRRYHQPEIADYLKTHDQLKNRWPPVIRFRVCRRDSARERGNTPHKSPAVGRRTITACCSIFIPTSRYGFTCQKYPNSAVHYMSATPARAGISAGWCRPRRQRGLSDPANRRYGCFAVVAWL